jgi:hypothetical protein
MGLLAALGCGGGGGDKTFDGDGYSFTYPGDWRDQTGKVEFSAQAGSEPLTSQVALAPGEGQDFVFVQVGPASPSITEDNIDQLKDEITRVVESLFQQAEGQLTAGPTRVTVGGLPALRFEGTGIASGGVSVRSRLTLIYDGRNQYAVNCQFTPDGAEEIERGCDEILSSFQVEGGGGKEGADKAFKGDGYSFAYPGEWSELEVAGTEIQVGTHPQRPPVYLGPEAPGRPDFLMVSITRLRRSVTEDNLDEAADEFADVARRVFQQVPQGRLVNGPTQVTVGGLPALRFEGAFNLKGFHVQNRVIVVFDGKTEYSLNCQFTRGDPEGVARGCEQVVESFQVE